MPDKDHPRSSRQRYDADLILLMEDGRVIERGAHEELMEARGVCYEMVLRQMESNRRSSEEVWR